MSVKEAVFPFARFPGVDILLSPEMKSTGEVMGVDYSPSLAYLKSQIGAGNTLPMEGNVFVSVRDMDKDELLLMARDLVDLGFIIYATRGTATHLYTNGIKSNAVFKIDNGRPNVLDMIQERNVSWIINTPEAGPSAMVDEIRMRSEAVSRGIPITTTINGLRSAVEGLKALRSIGEWDIRPIQEYHRRVPRLNI